MLKQNLLVIDDDRVFNTLLCQQLNGMGFEATGVGSWIKVFTFLRRLKVYAIH